MPTLVHPMVPEWIDYTEAPYYINSFYRPPNTFQARGDYTDILAGGWSENPGLDDPELLTPSPPSSLRRGAYSRIPLPNLNNRLVTSASVTVTGSYSATDYDNWAATGVSIAPGYRAEMNHFAGLDTIADRLDLKINVGGTLLWSYAYTKLTLAQVPGRWVFSREYGFGDELTLRIFRDEVGGVLEDEYHIYDINKVLGSNGFTYDYPEWIRIIWENGSDLQVYTSFDHTNTPTWVACDSVPSTYYPSASGSIVTTGTPKLILGSIPIASVSGSVSALELSGDSGLIERLDIKNVSSKTATSWNTDTGRTWSSVNAAGDPVHGISILEPWYGTSGYCIFYLVDSTGAIKTQRGPFPAYVSENGGTVTFNDTMIFDYLPENGDSLYCNFFTGVGDKSGPDYINAAGYNVSDLNTERATHYQIDDFYLTINYENLGKKGWKLGHI